MPARNLGLTPDIQLIRKASTAVSFGPRLVEKQPDTKDRDGGRRSGRSRKASVASEHDPVKIGQISRWGGQTPASDGKSSSLAGGVNSNPSAPGPVFGRPSHADPVVVRKRRERSPVTERGRRRKLEAEEGGEGAEESDTLYKIVPIDTADGGVKRDPGVSFSRSKRPCTSTLFKDLPWYVKRDLIEEANAGMDIDATKAEESEEVFGKRVKGGVIGRAVRSVGYGKEEEGSGSFSVDPGSDNDTAMNISQPSKQPDISLLSNHISFPSAVIPPPPTRAGILKPAGHNPKSTPGPGAYDVEKRRPTDNSTKTNAGTRSKMKDECKAILRERRAEGRSIGPGSYNADNSVMGGEALRGGKGITFFKAGVGERGGNTGKKIGVVPEIDGGEFRVGERRRGGGGGG